LWKVRDCVPAYQTFMLPPRKAVATTAAKAERRVARWSISTTSELGN
jgi:hypothetical protein